MRALAALFALVPLALLAVPVAAACSYAGEAPPGPGAFVLTDLADGTEWRVEVEHRELGGTCELSNPAGVSGGYIAWLETAAGERRVRAQDIHGDAPSVDLPFDARPFQMSLFDRTVLAPERGVLRMMDLDSGIERTLALPEEGAWTLHKHLFAYLDGFGEGATLSVYDARHEDWPLRDRAFPELGDRWWPLAVGDGWVVLMSEPPRGAARHFLLDLVTGEMRDFELPGGASIGSIDGGHLYLALFQDPSGAALDRAILARQALPDGPVERLAADPPFPATVTDGLLLARAYSMSEHRPVQLLAAPPSAPSAPHSGSGDADPTPSPSPPGRLLVPGAPLLGVLLLACGSAAAERWRKSHRRGR